jgi:hypothetical protein
MCLSEVKFLNEVYKVYIEIDTGCSYTNFSYKSLSNFSNSDALIAKRNAIENNLKKGLRYGVSDTRENKRRDKQLMVNKDFLSCTALNFSYDNVLLNINGYNFSHSIRMNYDRESNLLLGMDILKDFDFHIGTSNVTGEVVFLGCLSSRITESYLNALDKHFNYMHHSLVHNLLIDRCAFAKQEAYKEAYARYESTGLNDYISIMKGVY